MANFKKETSTDPLSPHLHPQFSLDQKVDSKSLNPQTQLCNQIIPVNNMVKAVVLGAYVPQSLVGVKN
jgi:hypothetical protein